MLTGKPVATQYSLGFVRENLPAEASSILEIGCGAGELAAELASAGLQVLAIDSASDCVAATAERGVECLQADWPVDLGRTFDAILFTRSLHHIQPLNDCLRAARAALRPGGKLIVEDFRAEGAASPSSAWYRGLVRLLHVSGCFVGGFDLEEALDADQPDDHHLSSSIQIDAALRSCFAAVEPEDSAYYFRYLEPCFLRPESASAMLAYELAMIAGGSIEALGRRFVASR